jgi:hypothetical protein
MTPARGITTANKSEVATETVSPPRVGRFVSDQSNSLQ